MNSVISKIVLLIEMEPEVSCYIEITFRTNCGYSIICTYNKFAKPFCCRIHYTGNQAFRSPQNVYDDTILDRLKDSYPFVERLISEQDFAK